ncbi:hypothetical protein CR513_62653, partial [Mucuna pruriens]
MTHATPWYADIRASITYKSRLESDAKYYVWVDPYLWRMCNDQVMRRIRGQVDPPLLSLSFRRRPLWINEDSPKIFSKMLIPLSWPAINARKSRWPLAEDMKCLHSQLYFVKSLTYRVLTLWGHSPSPKE